jgi:hypothetical protein
MEDPKKSPEFARVQKLLADKVEEWAKQAETAGFGFCRTHLWKYRPGKNCEACEGLKKIAERKSKNV